MGSRFKLRIRRAVIAATVPLFLLTGCSNLYAPLANRTSDEARYEEAKKALNAANYDLAVTNFELLSSDYLKDSKVREYYASALAGKCGFNFSAFLDFMGSADFSTTPFFHSLMNQFTDKAIFPTYCTAAEDQLKAIWAVQTPTASQQFLMVMLSMSKMGAVLRNKADLDGANSLGDGTPDASFDVCSDSSTNLSDAEIAEVVTGFSSMLLNITAFLGSFSGGTGSAITAINTACALLDPNPCSTTEAENVTAPMIASMRDLLATNILYLPAQFGIGTCALPTPVDSCCP